MYPAVVFYNLDTCNKLVDAFIIFSRYLTTNCSLWCSAGITGVLVRCDIFFSSAYILISVNFFLGLTSSRTKGLPPFNILTSMSSLPPAWNFTSISSIPSYTYSQILCWISSWMLDSVSFLLFTSQGVWDRYLENFT